MAVEMTAGTVLERVSAIFATSPSSLLSISPVWKASLPIQRLSIILEKYLKRKELRSDTSTLVSSRLMMMEKMIWTRAQAAKMMM